MGKYLFLGFMCFTYSFALISESFGQDILGCGGFVKTDLEINFSQVEVKLYTKQGTLKDHTDCAPNNGYYFLPLYDKGEYILKIEPPDGWSFEPKEVVLNVDGTTDPCSKGKDINFIFKGFAVTGRVVSAGEENMGPSGVRVTLCHEGSEQILHEGLTGEQGIFQFTPVPPGFYTIRASHLKWRLLQDSTSIHLSKDNVAISPGSLVVAGYDVSGSVTSDAEPIKGVSFVLFSAQPRGMTREVYGCDKTPLAGFKMSGALCHVSSDEQGHFVFPTVPPGHYRVIPHYKGPHSIKFDVRPAQVEFTVAHQSFVIETEFKMKGFSVSGRVLLKEGGRGVSGAVVFLDNKESGVTGPDGTYHLENMQAGTYQLHIKANDMEFSGKTVKITPNTPQLADSFPSAFKVCGHVAPHHLVSGSSGSTYVLLSRAGQSPVIVEIQADSGLFCVFLEPGQYEARVRISDMERNRGLQYYPEVHIVEVADGPVLSGIEFMQLKVKVTGSIYCLEEDCGNIPIHLQGIPVDGEAHTSVAIVISQGNKYTFTDILPGKYKVSVDKDDWCWDSVSYIVNAGSAAESTVPTFTQTGYAITFISSHDTQVEYKLKTADSTGLAGRLGVTRGTTKSCVAVSGSYILTPVGCHSYPKPSIYLAHLTSPVHLTAVAHTAGGRIISTEIVNDIFINILSGEDGKLKHRLGPLTPKLDGVGKTIYYFELMISEGEVVILEPVAGLLLFTPQRITLTGEGDCVEIAAEFRAEKGHLIEGQIIPPSAGIRITVVRSDNSVVAFTETARDGKFRIGPLQSNINYRVKAEKEGFVLIGPDANGNFNAHKLAEVVVEVVDKADGKPLQGVLLSLSGGESFRRNSQTGTDGKMTFSSLSPSEYFLRPMMKEYRFEPPSKMITVIEGATVNVLLSGIRVAFSAYGLVTSLSGEGEEGVLVEAVGQGKCSHYQEEGTTETNGHFRIRGLHPECEYVISVKQGPEVNQHILRATPNRISIQVNKSDITGLRMMVFHPLTHMDVTAHITTTSPEYLNTLHIKLCREDSPDSPVHISRLDGPTQSSTAKSFTSSTRSLVAVLVFPPIPLDGRAYFLQLESTLSHTTHSYSTHAVHFRANSTYKLVHLVFKPEARVVEQELGQSSYLALALFIMGVLIYLNQLKLIPLIAWFSQMLSSSLAASARTSSSNSDHSAGDAVVIEPVIGISKRKPKPRKT